MGEIIVRYIKADDFKDIYLLNIDLGYSYEEQKVKQRIEYILGNTMDTVLVAELNEEVVGYVHGRHYQLLYHDPLIDILGLVVKEKARRMGVGKRLMNEIESYAKENGYSGVRLVSGESRVEAHRFYESLGYISRKNQKNYNKIFDNKDIY